MAHGRTGSLPENERDVVPQSKYITLSDEEQQLILQLQQDLLISVAREEDTLGLVNQICLLAEQLLPNAVATVMLMDEASEYLNIYAAPSIPPDGVMRLKRLRPGPGGGSCGNAVFRNEAQFVQNTFADPRWLDLRQLAYDFNLCSCWANPIFSPTGKAIGSFALSSFEHRSPSPFHRKILEIGASIIGIVLERGKSQEFKRLFGEAFAGINQGVMITDANLRIERVNQAFTDVLGYTFDEVVGKTPTILCSGLQDPAFYKRMWDEINTHGHWRGELWNKRKNGEIFPEWLSISVVHNADGELSHYIGIFSDATEHYATQRKLDAEYTLRQKIIESIPAALFLLDANWRPILINQLLLETLQITEEQCKRTPILEFIHEDDNNAVAAATDGATNGEKVGFEARFVSKRGNVIPHLFNATSIMIDDQRHLLGVALDISRNKQIEASLASECEKNWLMFRHVTDGVHILDEKGHVLEASDSFCEMLGYTRDEILQMDVTQWDAKIPAPDLQEAITHRFMSSGQYQVETRHRRKDGTLIDVEISGACINLNGHPVLFNSSRDVTDRKRSEANTEYLAYHDPLTELPNRPLFLDRLGQALESARRRQRYGAVMFLDLDRFKQINDVHGHWAGDTVLRTVAHRLRNCVRQVDTVARFGGDEFVILLSELADDPESAANLALTIAEKIRGAQEEPTRVGDNEYYTSVSIGISLFPKQGETVDNLIREADIAMYRAKDSGRNTLVFFEQDMQAAIAERYTLERDLRNALRQGQLSLFLQSQVDKGGEIVGAEALVRWKHPTRGLVPPSAFIPLAEETGIIVAIGDWVLSEVCKLIAQLEHAGHRLQLAVNVSPRQFAQEHFVTRVKEILQETNANPACLTLEITENLLIESGTDAIARMQTLSGLGLRFSIDDFGTGYSSLAYLKRLPVDELKIDKSFVQDVPDDVDDVALIETILSMAHHFGFSVVAEGVESRKQFQFLARHRCDVFQGYLFERPIPEEEWLSLLM